MSRTKPYKHGKRGVGRFVQLPEWLLASQAWASMKPGPRALYVELKRRYNGSNNGKIFLSHREAAKALSVGRDTVGGYFAVLLERGFLVQTRGHCLGPAGIGQAATYALTEDVLDGQAATKDFMRWQWPKKQKPRRKSQHFLAGNSSKGCRKSQSLGDRMSEKPTALPAKPAKSVSEFPAIYTCGHAQQQSVWLGLCGKATGVGLEFGSKAS